jgi:hypothetical protein
MRAETLITPLMADEIIRRGADHPPPRPNERRDFSYDNLTILIYYIKYMLI